MSAASESGRWHASRQQQRAITVGLGVIALLVGLLTHSIKPAEASNSDLLISGRLHDKQGQPVVEAELLIYGTNRDDPLAAAASREDGSWSLLLDSEDLQAPVWQMILEVKRHHFRDLERPLSESELTQLADSGSLRMDDIVLDRKVTAGFWAATLIFIAVLVIIAFDKLHSTTAALTGLSLLFVSTFLGDAVLPDLYIFSFERALSYINWEVIFLVMGMMIVIAIIENTGVFQWTAFQAYRWSGGRVWLLILILMGVTAVASALLDNFTTMLLMTPISLQIGLALGINPLALIIPEVLASNVGGISTLIGTPTNILIGAHAGIGFSGFLANQTAGVVFALAVAGGYVLWHYRREWRGYSAGISPKLYQRLEENARIEQPDALAKSGVVFGLILAGFVIGERFHIAPAVPALIGATALLVWLKPDVRQMITAVDWTTLVFFMALFMVVGGVQEVGLISFVADGIGQLVGQSLPLAILVIVFGVGTLSVAIVNIPLAASMLPVVDFLTGSIPGASSQVLYYALSMGAAMGGNGFLVGAEANLVTAGITAQAGSPISFGEFMKVGLPVTYLTLAAGYLWLLLRFVF